MKRFLPVSAACCRYLPQSSPKICILDKLSDCDTLVRVQNMLQESVSSSCRMPRDEAERHLCRGYV